MANTKLGKELSVTAPNEVGTMAKICGPISEAKVNIWALSAWGEGNKGYFRFITDNNKKAYDALKTTGFPVEEKEIVVTELEDKPGTCFTASRKLAQAGVNINYWYYTTCGGCPTSRIVFSTNNNKKAVEVLG